MKHTNALQLLSLFFVLSLVISVGVAHDQNGLKKTEEENKEDTKAQESSVAEQKNEGINLGELNGDYVIELDSFPGHLSQEVIAQIEEKLNEILNKGGNKLANNAEQLNEPPKEHAASLTEEQLDLDKVMSDAKQQRSFMNYDKALSMFEALGKNGVSDAWYQGASMLMFDMGKEENLARSLDFLNEAVGFGHAQAQYLKGFAHSVGLSELEPNLPMALLYYHFAAEGNSTEAEMALGFRHQTGEGLERSCKKALDYYSKAAKKVTSSMRAVGYVGKHPDRKRISEMETTKASPHQKGIIDHIQWAALQGDVQQMVTMGNLYVHNLYGVEQNFHEAFLFFQRATVHNHPEAWGQLGNLYLQGLGVQQDYAKALEAFSKGAALGHAISFNGLGFMYWKGLGVEKNVAEARAHFEKASDLGNVEGKINLGIMYLEGIDIPKDLVKAFMHLSIAARGGHSLALYYMGYMHEHGLAVAHNCQVAIQNYKAVVERGSTSSILDLAQAKYDQKDYSSALLLNELASELGFEIAQSNAAYLYENRLGYNKPDHMVHALQRYRQSAHQGNIKSKIRVGDAFYYGQGVAKDAEVAALHYTEAVQMGNPQAMFNLGYMHQYGDGVPQDFHLSKRYYDMAYENTPEAYIPTRLALLVWCVHFVIVNYITTPEMRTFVQENSDGEVAMIVGLVCLLILLVARMRFLAIQRQ